MTSNSAHFDAHARTWDDDPMRSARAEAVAAGIRAGVPLRRGLRGLEFGCGTGLLSFALRADVDTITLADTSSGMLEVLRAKIAAQSLAHLQPVLIDEAGSGLAAQSFDLITSLMTLHHLPDTALALRRFHDWLSPGGHLCLADLDAEDGSFHHHEASVHPGFERVALERLAGEAGFRQTRFATVFTIAKGTPEREYPVFLMIARRP